MTSRRRVEGVARAAAPDPLSAQGAIGELQSGGIGMAHGVQQGRVGNLHLLRDMIGVGAAAERAGRAAAAQLDGLDLDLGIWRRVCSTGLNAPSDFLVAMAVQRR